MDADIHLRTRRRRTARSVGVFQFNGICRIAENFYEPDNQQCADIFFIREPESTFTEKDAALLVVGNASAFEIIAGCEGDDFALRIEGFDLCGHRLLLICGKFFHYWWWDWSQAGRLPVSSDFSGWAIHHMGGHCSRSLASGERIAHESSLQSLSVCQIMRGL